MKPHRSHDAQCSETTRQLITLGGDDTIAQNMLAGSVDDHVIDKIMRDRLSGEDKP